ncbi:hypothetical protein E8E11_007905 [Didymella keratinophila]|nr:hypothetical protein E8E11_007905 [Didymella keratinophila]
MLDNKKLCEVEKDMLARMQSGARYTTSDWSKLLDLLVVFKAPEANLFVTETGSRPAVRIGETFVGVRMIDSCWAVTICKPTDNTVTNYCVSHSTCERKDLGHIAHVLGVEKTLTELDLPTETSLQDTRHVPFQDAILFDMLLDIVADGFVPHQRRLDDGLAFQLEILEALERAPTHAWQSRL